MKLLVLLGMAYLLFSSVVSAELIINEIMYAPSQCSDSFCEWIELYNNGTHGVNLTGWALCGSAVIGGFINHSTGATQRDQGIVLASQGFALLTDGGSGTDVYTNFSVDGGALALHVSTSSLCGGLSNSGGIINLSNSTEQILAQYGSNLANGNGKTVEWSGSFFGESLLVNGTPGKANSIAGIANTIRALRITEFLPDPSGSDDADMPLGELVEIYNQGSQPVDARGLVLYDSQDDNELFISDTTTLNGTIIPALGFIVVYRNGDSDFSLNNDGYDEVRLFNGSSSGLLLDRISYSGSTDGMSWSNLSGLLNKTRPTPGSLNNGSNACDWSIDVQVAPTFHSGETVDWNVSVQKKYGLSTSTSVVGVVEDISGRAVKSYTSWTNVTVSSSKMVHYSPTLRGEVFVIRFFIEHLGCGDDNLGDNSDVGVVVDSGYRMEKPFLEIKEVLDIGLDGIAYWGNTIRAKVAVYKGNNSKTTLSFWAEDDEGKKASRVTTMKVFEDFRNVTATLPLEIVDNCNGKLKDGGYTLVFDGLDGRAKEKLVIAKPPQGLCTGVRKSSYGGNNSFSFFIEKIPQEIRAGDQFSLPIHFIGDDIERKGNVWAYVYRGPKSYSGEREGNKKNFLVGAEKEKSVDLPIMLDDEMEEGVYKIKVQVLLDERKTAQEFTDEIFVRKKKGKILDIFVEQYSKPQESKVVVTTSAAAGGRMRLLSLSGEQVKQVRGNTTQFRVPLVQGDNMFFVKLQDEDDQVLDVSQHAVKKEGDVVQVIEKKNGGEEGFNRMTGSIVSNLDMKTDQERVVYEGKSVIAYGFAPWLLVGALVSLVGYLVFWRV